MPLIKATLLTLPASSRTYSVRMGAIEPVATWMINVVTNRLSTSFGFLSVPHVQHLFFADRLEFFSDAEQGDEKAEYEHTGGNKEYRT